ncbi:MAG: siphovirus ReqiPepy6 Gp37-like family protein [Clostridia bacterium]|nr:siphovirus ReqiPepy6 Gp37-like family protein [Clostridia bacterium]
MAIDYVEIRSEETTDLLGIVDTAKSIIWHSVYFGVGDFEIYVKATPDTVALLKEDRLVTRPDDLEVGVIEAIAIADDPQNGAMVTARGRFAKCLLERRHIYKLAGTVNTPTILRGNVEAEVRRVVYENAIDCPFDSKRNIPLLALGQLSDIPLKIVDENGYAAQKQVSYENLLTYTDEVLQEYGMGATVILDADAKKLLYVVYAGADRSADNAAGNVPIIFSKEFDNLSSSSYQYDGTMEKNVALIGGAGEGLARFFSLLAGSQAGLQRRETFVNASSIANTYEDENGEEQTYSEDEYRAMLNAQGKQTLQASQAVEAFNGAIDVSSSQWQYNRDFALGDIVTQQDNSLGVFVNVRVLDLLEVQDENGYAIEANNQT